MIMSTAVEGNTLKDCIGIDSFEDDIFYNEMVTEFLNSLSERQHQIVTMRLNGYTHAEIGSHMNVCSRTINRELKKIRNILTERCGC